VIIEYSFDESFKKAFKKLERMNNSYELRQLDGIGDQLDLNEFRKQFFSKSQTADVSVDSNSNIDKVTMVHYNNEIAKPLGRIYGYYLLWSQAKILYNEEIAFDVLKKQFTKEIYVNDLHNFGSLPYCFAFSTLELMNQGIKFPGGVSSKPAKHLSSFMGHLIAFLTYSCQQLSGAVGLPDMLIAISYYVDKLYRDNSNVPKEFLDRLIEQELQGIIYQFNQPFRGAQQTPFTNVSIYDNNFLDKICSEYMFPDGSKPNKKTVQHLQDMFLDIRNDILKTVPITFPIMTACFSKDEDNNILDRNFLSFIASKNLPYGALSVFSGSTSTTSVCCRLRVNAKNDFFNSYGSGSGQIGSLSVVTLNLPRLAYISKTKEEFLSKLRENVEVASRINHIKRKMLEKDIANGYLPLYTHNFMSLKKQYSTCGVVGLYESVEILKCNILDVEGQELVSDILHTINDVNLKQEKKFDTPHNSEIVPAEASAIKLAQADKILGHNHTYKLYSNQVIPLDKNIDIFDRIKIQGKFDNELSGGSALFLNFADKITDIKYMEKIIEHTIKSGVIYFVINYLLQQCKNEHVTVGNSLVCYICNEKILNRYERIVGYLSNIANWETTRKNQDTPNRIRYENNDL
jgi:ribonucleoside-triphosphate reductase